MLLLRHGQSTWNEAGRWQGWADPPLSELGEQQARDAAPFLEPLGFEAVATSDLERARATAEIVASKLGLAAPVEVPEIRERDVGEWSGLTSAEIEQRFPEARRRWVAGELSDPPEGEAIDVFSGRVLEGLERLSQGPERRLLVITHSGCIRAVEHRVGAAPGRYGNLSGRWFEWAGGHVSAGSTAWPLEPEERTRSDTQ